MPHLIYEPVVGDEACVRCHQPILGHYTTVPDGMLGTFPLVEIVCMSCAIAGLEG